MSARQRMQMARMTLLDLNVATLPAVVHERFWSKVAIVDDLEACWLWTGAINIPGVRDLDSRGRPRFRLSSKPPILVYAARFALAGKLNASLSSLDGFEACHIVECTSVLCVNPRHLYKGTTQQNRDDRYQWRRARLELVD